MNGNGIRSDRADRVRQQRGRPTDPEARAFKVICDNGKWAGAWNQFEAAHGGRLRQGIDHRGAVVSERARVAAEDVEPERWGKAPGKMVSPRTLTGGHDRSLAHAHYHPSVPPEGQPVSRSLTCRVTEPLALARRTAA